MSQDHLSNYYGLSVMLTPEKRASVLLAHTIAYALRIEGTNPDKIVWKKYEAMANRVIKEARNVAR
jgi:hypothetical protein